MAEGRPAVLVINAGSSSLRAAVFDAPGGRAEATALPALARVHFEERATQSLLERALDELRSVAAGFEIVAVAHRVVHGGPDRAEPAAIDAAVLVEIESLVPLAPLHQPHNIAGIRAAITCLPRAVQVACFDTAFHRTCPAKAQRFAIPTRLHDRGIRRYGFHGLSYESIRSQLPGVVIQLVAEGMDAAALTRLLYHESGLLGVSGSTGDMRTLLASDDPQAREAVDLFCHRAVREIGSMAAALGGVDAIVFTAGIGERSPAVRRRIATELGWLGLSLDVEANTAATGGTPARISAAESRIAAWVIPTQEERTMLGHALDVLARSAA